MKHENGIEGVEVFLKQASTEQACSTVIVALLMDSTSIAFLHVESRFPFVPFKTFISPLRS